MSDENPASLIVVLIRGADMDDQPIFAYVRLTADRLPAFYEAQQAGHFDPEAFGTIIEAGYGEPSRELKTRMETEYGFDHDAPPLPLASPPDTD